MFRPCVLAGVVTVCVPVLTSGCIAFRDDEAADGWGDENDIEDDNDEGTWNGDLKDDWGGAGDGSEDLETLAADTCAKWAECEFNDNETCVSDLVAQFDALRSANDPLCDQLADAFVIHDTCVISANCDELWSGDACRAEFEPIEDLIYNQDAGSCLDGIPPGEDTGDGGGGSPENCDIGGLYPNGDDLTAFDASLSEDSDNLADCESAYEAYVLYFLVGAGFSADFSGNEVWWSRDGGEVRYCMGFLAGVTASGDDCDGTADCIVICPLCLSEVPSEMAVQFEDDDGLVSNALCVDTRGA